MHHVSKVCIHPGNYANVPILLDEINSDISHCTSLNSEAGTDLSGLHIFMVNDRVIEKTVQFLNLTSFYIKLIFF